MADVEIDPPMELEDHVVHSGLEPRSRTVLVFAGDMEWSREEALTLTVAGEMLGIRLRERVREELGGTYSISVNADDSSLPDPEYLVSIIFGSDPSRAEELLDEVMEEVDWLRTGGEQKYLDTVKELLRTSGRNSCETTDSGSIRSSPQCNGGSRSFRSSVSTNCWRR